MPLFGRPKPPKTPGVPVPLTYEKVLEELLWEDRTAYLILTDQKCTFQNGEYTPENGTGETTNKDDPKDAE